MPEVEGQQSLWDSATELWKTLHPCPVCGEDRVALGHYIANTTEHDVGDLYVDVVPCPCARDRVRLRPSQLHQMDDALLEHWATSLWPQRPV